MAPPLVFFWCGMAYNDRKVPLAAAVDYSVYSVHSGLLLLSDSKFH